MMNDIEIRLSIYLDLPSHISERRDESRAGISDHLCR